MLKSYRYSNHVNVEALALKESAFPQAVTSKLGLQADPPSEAAAITASASLRACGESEEKSHEDVLPRETIQRALAPIHRPSPALLDKEGNL